MADRFLTLLVVDHDTTFRMRLSRAFEGRGFAVRAAANGTIALDLARRTSPAFAVVELHMPGESGLDVVRELKALAPDTNIVVLTGYGRVETAREAVRLGATHCLPKPVDVDDILAAFALAHRPLGGQPAARSREARIRAVTNTVPAETAAAETRHESSTLPGSLHRRA